MGFKTKSILEKIEQKIETSYKLPIFKGYVAINKTGVEKLIDEIYENLPQDLIMARKFLRENNYNLEKINKTSHSNRLYDYLRELEIIFNKALNVATFALVNVKEIENILNRISDNIPEEITRAERLH